MSIFDEIERGGREKDRDRRDLGEEALAALAADEHILRKLYNMEMTLLNMRGLEETIRAATAQIENDHLVDRAWVVLLEKTETATLAKELDLANKLDKRLTVVPVNAFDEFVISEDTPVFIDEQLEKFDDILPPAWFEDFNCMVLTPLVMGGKVIGCLAMADRNKHRFEEKRDIFLVSVIGTTFALAFNCAALHDHVQRIAIADPLTGLGNRRSLDEDLQAEFARSERYGVPLSVLLINADGTSGINEQFGQEEGDKFIRHVADGLRDCIRTEDKAFRVGGDEFAIILPAQDRSQAKVVAERIVTWMDKSPVRLHAPLGFKAITPSVSIGVAEMDEDEVHNPRTLLSRADDRLYEVKLKRHREAHPRDKPRRN